jgi:hypothetical protein
VGTFIVPGLWVKILDHRGPDDSGVVRRYPPWVVVVELRFFSVPFLLSLMTSLVSHYTFFFSYLWSVVPIILYRFSHYDLIYKIR